MVLFRLVVLSGCGCAHSPLLQHCPVFTDSSASQAQSHHPPLQTSFWTLLGINRAAAQMPLVNKPTLLPLESKRKSLSNHNYLIVTTYTCNKQLSLFHSPVPPDWTDWNYRSVAVFHYYSHQWVPTFFLQGHLFYHWVNWQPLPKWYILWIFCTFNAKHWQNRTSCTITTNSKHNKCWMFVWVFLTF